jgi:hypothetical protein
MNSTKKISSFNHILVSKASKQAKEREREEEV